MNRQPDHIAIDMRPLMQQQQQQQQQYQQYQQQQQQQPYYTEPYAGLSISSPLPDMYRSTQQLQTTTVWTVLMRLLR